MNKKARAESGDMQYPLRVNRGLWAKVKARTVKDGTTIRFVVTRFLKDYAAGSSAKGEQ